MERSKEELLSNLLAPENVSSVEPATTQALVRKVDALTPATTALGELMKVLPKGMEGPLEEIFRYALLGVSLGFAERNLSPFLEEHLEIVQPLLEDIRAVYEQVRSVGAEVTAEEFHRQAFDFGLDKAYYLDWRLYMSKEMY